MLCNVKPDCVIENLTLPVLYQAPIMLEENHLSEIVCRELNLNLPPANLGEWNEMLKRINQRDKTVRIAVVGKYVKLHDAYLSVAEALHHGGYENGHVLGLQGHRRQYRFPLWRRTHLGEDLIGAAAFSPQRPP